VYLYWQETKVGLAGKAGENVKLVAAQEMVVPGAKFLIADVKVTPLLLATNHAWTLLNVLAGVPVGEFGAVQLLVKPVPLVLQFVLAVVTGAFTTVVEGVAATAGLKSL
jgi:hypothetical protein